MAIRPACDSAAGAPGVNYLGIIFDMDGVLMESSPFHGAAFRKTFEEAGVKAPDYASIAGMRTDEAVRLVLRENGLLWSEERMAALAAKKSALALQSISDANPIAPGCAAVLEALASSYPLALATSASKAATEWFLAHNQLAPLFRCVLTGADVPAAKPDPLIYAEACKRLQLAPHDCLVIEDAVKGVVAAKRAGTAVWAITTTCAAADLLKAGADQVIQELGELLSLAGDR